MAKIDDRLDNQDWGYEYRMSDYATSKQSELEYEREGKAEIAKLKQALYTDMYEIISFSADRADAYRQLKEYFGEK